MYCYSLIYAPLFFTPPFLAEDEVRARRQWSRVERRQRRERRWVGACKRSHAFSVTDASKLRLTHSDKHFFVCNGAWMHICTDVLRGFRMLIISAHRWCCCCFLSFCVHFWVVGVSTPVLISPKKASITGTLTRIPFLIIPEFHSSSDSRHWGIQGLPTQSWPAANVGSEVTMCKCWMISASRHAAGESSWPKV